MKKNQIGWIILIGGAAVLAWYWWSNRQTATGPMAPGATVPLTGTTGSVTPRATGTTTNLRTIDDLAGPRGAYGEQLRCNQTGGRFIKTITAPAYGVCVNQQTFDAWLRSGVGGDYTTDEQVRGWLASGNR